MSVITLGISAFYHDSAAALCRDGEIIAAAQEERFTRKKHDARFPKHAINYCLGEAYVEADEINAIVFYDNPLLCLDRILQSFAMAGRCGFPPEIESQWQRAAQSTLGAKWNVAEMIRDTLKCDVPIHFTWHHLSHAASAFYPSPFKEAAILTVDGVGEWATTSLGVGEHSDIKILKEIHYPHSLGLLYSAFTYFCGFKVNSGEYKLMGLAPYGTPRFADKIRDYLIEVRCDGSYRLNLEYFGFMDSKSMTNSRFDELFEGPPRTPETPITRREMDLAASIQLVTEEVMLGLVEHSRKLSSKRNLVLAGGVALNCVANGKILRRGAFDKVWIQPAAGDAGGALGAALLGQYKLFNVERKVHPTEDSQKGSYLGPSYSSEEVRAFLDGKNVPYARIEDGGSRAKIVAEVLSSGKVVGFFSGRMEFGPRALGARSILGDPRNPETQVSMNLKIKYRESFRPFAPTVLSSHAKEYFEIDAKSPYMLLVAPLVAGRRTKMDWSKFNEGSDDLMNLVRQARSDLPAITHIDYSARVQTLDQDKHPDFAAVLEEFGKLTGYYVLVNTSFNVRGEPIVCSPKDAYLCFMRTEIDLLVLEDCLLYKDKQSPLKDDTDWRNEYELD